MPDSRNIDSGSLLARRIRKGDLKAFDILYNTYSQKLYGFAFSMLKNHEDAKEIIQETFFKIWNKRQQLDPTCPIRTFIFSVAYHNAIDLIRKRLKDERFRAHVQARLSEYENNAETASNCMEMIRILNQVVGNLPEKRRQIYRLSREEGLSHKEIAEKLNLSTKTVENQINLALKDIRENLSSNDLLCFLLLICLF